MNVRGFGPPNNGNAAGDELRSASFVAADRPLRWAV